MGFGNVWGNMLPPSYRNVKAPATTTKVNTADFDNEYEAFVAEQKRLKAERLAKEAAEKAAKDEQEAEINATYGYVETVPSEQVAEVAYQAFIQEDEKPKSKKKKKTEAVVEETPEVTEEVAED